MNLHLKLNLLFFRLDQTPSVKRAHFQWEDGSAGKIVPKMKKKDKQTKDKTNLPSIDQ